MRQLLIWCAENRRNPPAPELYALHRGDVGLEVLAAAPASRGLAAKGTISSAPACRVDADLGGDRGEWATRTSSAGPRAHSARRPRRSASIGPCRGRGRAAARSARRHCRSRAIVSLCSRPDCGRCRRRSPTAPIARPRSGSHGRPRGSRTRRRARSSARPTTAAARRGAAPGTRSPDAGAGCGRLPARRCPSATAAPGTRASRRRRRAGRAGRDAHDRSRQRGVQRRTPVATPPATQDALHPATRDHARPRGRRRVERCGACRAWRRSGPP